MLWPYRGILQIFKLNPIVLLLEGKSDKFISQEFILIGCGNTPPASIKHGIQWSAEILLNYSFYFHSTSKPLALPCQWCSLKLSSKKTIKNPPKWTNNEQCITLNPLYNAYPSDIEGHPNLALKLFLELKQNMLN